jgi:hypothetical protein
MKNPMPNLRDAEDKMAVLLGEGGRVLMAAIFAFNTGNIVVQIAADQILVNNLLDIGTERFILPFKPLVIDLDKGFKVISNVVNFGDTVLDISR